MRCQIFRQIIPIEEVRVTLLPTKTVKVDGIKASKCAIKALAVYPRYCLNSIRSYSERLYGGLWNSGNFGTGYRV